MSWHMAFEELLRQKFCLFDPWWSMIRCSKGWPMAHFYHHSFAFAAFFVILVWSHLLFQTGKSKGLIARTHHSEAKGWRTWLWSQGKKKIVTLTDRTSSILFSFNVIFFQSGCHPHTWTTNTETSHYYESCGLGTSPPLGTMILRKLSTVNITARQWTCQCRIHHLTSNSCNVIMDGWSQSAIEKWSRTAARRRKRSIFGTFGSYGIWWKLDESQNFYWGFDLPPLRSKARSLGRDQESFSMRLIGDTVFERHKLFHNNRMLAGLLQAFFCTSIDFMVGWPPMLGRTWYHKNCRVMGHGSCSFLKEPSLNKQKLTPWKSTHTHVIHLYKEKLNLVWMTCFGKKVWTFPEKNQFIINVLDHPKTKSSYTSMILLHVINRMILPNNQPSNQTNKKRHFQHISHENCPAAQHLSTSLFFIAVQDENISLNVLNYRHPI